MDTSQKQQQNTFQNKTIPSSDLSSQSINKNKIKPDDLKKLDEFIQNCLNKFVFIDPKKSFYDATGDDKDFIISHKSTIPDLVIWNKNFNKNECYVEADKTKENSFPRFRFYLRLNNDNNNQKEKEKKTKKNPKKKKGKKNQNVDNDNENNNQNVQNNNNANDNNNTKKNNKKKNKNKNEQNENNKFNHI